MNMILSHQGKANEFCNEIPQHILERLKVKGLIMPSVSVDVEQAEPLYTTDWKTV